MSYFPALLLFFEVTIKSFSLPLAKIEILLRVHFISPPLFTLWGLSNNGQMLVCSISILPVRPSSILIKLRRMESGHLMARIIAPFCPIHPKDDDGDDDDHHHQHYYEASALTTQSKQLKVIIISEF